MQYTSEGKLLFIAPVFAGIKSPSTLRKALSTPEMYCKKQLGIKLSEASLVEDCCLLCWLPDK